MGGAAVGAAPRPARKEAFRAVYADGQSTGMQTQRRSRVLRDLFALVSCCVSVAPVLPDDRLRSLWLFADHPECFRNGDVRRAVPERYLLAVIVRQLA